ncbi:hypothetical protein [Endozoicomonas sp. GU-1]|uniref:hypothetical protein n=1 Tax=Endozoicomonas sp. GU-1 TaxID=3009078 RepID=UPI0022B39932|nr:hypothetical protein [Endozoicomonas sp. GU-1]WBA80150.1 hypothetical protein O2T12_17630 [Endozoicomonas sp. GU-1]WBA87725.1 hypothetical protein O3276_06855 [Endozoicomonas sp. GU-1]
MRHLFKTCLLFYCLLWGMSAQAELVIEVTQGNDQAVSMAVSPFSWTGGKVLPEDPAAIIDNDLKLSGLFKALPRTSMLSFPASEPEVYYRDWRLLGASYLITGQVTLRDRAYTMNYQLYDVVRGKRIAKGGI